MNPAFKAEYLAKKEEYSRQYVSSIEQRLNIQLPLEDRQVFEDLVAIGFAEGVIWAQTR